MSNGKTSFLVFTSVLNLLNTWNESAEQQQNAGAQSGADGVQTDGSGYGPEMRSIDQNTADTSSAAEELVEFKRKHKAPPEAVDEWASRTITLKPGQSARIVYNPPKGHNVRVRRIAFDRRDDHDYAFVVGGDTNAGTHRIKFQSPRRVMNGQPIVSEVENNSSSETTFDWELEAWAVPTGV